MTTSELARKLREVATDMKQVDEIVVFPPWDYETSEEYRPAVRRVAEAILGEDHTVSISDAQDVSTDDVAALLSYLAAMVELS